MRAAPPGSTRYWSWLFAAPPVRAPLLGIYALLAEWQALMDPATEAGVAHLKLAWWRDEMQRLTRGSGVHPISSYLAALPQAGAADFTPLLLAAESAVAQVGGAPLERGADLERQTRSLWGNPTALASRLAFAAADDTGLHNCTAALAAADYLSRAIRGYRREARLGRVPFAIDELLAAGIDNADLAADVAPPPLEHYLQQLCERAVRYAESAPGMLPHARRADHRHLLVMAALVLEHLSRTRAGGREPPPERRRIRDMLLAWKTAMRANL